MKTPVLSFASLAAPLARSQTQAVIDRVQAVLPNVSCQLTVLPAPGRFPDRAEEEFLALSTGELEYLSELLLNGEVRLVVTEAADLNLPLPEGIAMLCVPDRAAPFDAYLNRQGLIMDEMESGGTVGVLSARSRHQLAAVWPELTFTVIRGGVDHAMEIHLAHHGMDGLVLPAAVTEHLGIQGVVAEIFAPEFVLPSPGQGILVVLGREADLEARQMLAKLHSDDTAVELAAETAFRSRMISDRDLPIAALARVEDGELCIAGAIGAGLDRVIVTGAVTEAEAVGAGLAQQILSSGDGFASLMEAVFPDGLPVFADEEAVADSAETDSDQAAGPGARYDDEFAGFAEFDGFDDDEESGGEGDGEFDDDETETDHEDEYADEARFRQQRYERDPDDEDDYN